jgi:hypothetical protein
MIIRPEADNVVIDLPVERIDIPDIHRHFTNKGAADHGNGLTLVYGVKQHFRYCCFRITGLFAK